MAVSRMLALRDTSRQLGAAIIARAPRHIARFSSASGGSSGIPASFFTSSCRAARLASFQGAYAAVIAMRTFHAASAQASRQARGQTRRIPPPAVRSCEFLAASFVLSSTAMTTYRQCRTALPLLERRLRGFAGNGASIDRSRDLSRASLPHEREPRRCRKDYAPLDTPIVKRPSSLGTTSRRLRAP